MTATENPLKTEENKNIWKTCPRCQAEHKEKRELCYTCDLVAKDIEYLDEGSEQHLNESKDRTKAVMADYFEGERDVEDEVCSLEQ